jgi:hypothetical protein
MHRTAALPLFTTMLDCVPSAGRNAFEMTDFNAAAVTHMLSTAGEIIIASKRIRLSWLTRDAPDRSARVTTRPMAVPPASRSVGLTARWRSQNACPAPRMATVDRKHSVRARRFFETSNLRSRINLLRPYDFTQP